MEVIYAAPADTEPYVAIGPSPNLSITVHRDTFDRGFVIATIFFVVLVIIGIIFILIMTFDVSAPQQPPSTLEPLVQLSTLTENYGAGVNSTVPAPSKLSFAPDASGFTSKYNCLSSPHTMESNGNCVCQPGFFGDTCNRERHDKKYFAVGSPEENTLYTTVISKKSVSAKSFIDDSCSSYCDQDSNCVGFQYTSNGNCTLLSGEVVANKIIPYDLNSDSTLYLKSSENLHFPNNIFLGKYAFSFPTRYWLIKETEYYVRLDPNQLHKLSFVPSSAINYGNYTGIYRTHPFTLQDVPHILKQGPTSSSYIHGPGADLDMPENWINHQIYVMYV
jgi:hypothetical protein